MVNSYLSSSGAQGAAIKAGLGLLLSLVLAACGGGSGGGGGSGNSTGSGSGGGSSSGGSLLTVGGSISGLINDGLILTNAGTQISIKAGATSFQFTAITPGSAYAVSIMQQPDSEVCTLANASGTATGNVSLVAISCQTDTKLHAFDNNTTEGMLPYSGLVADVQGNLYGTAVAGGAYNGGSIFKITPQGIYSTLYSFGGVANDGESPYADLVIDAAGNLYGTTANGGPDGAGIVFKYSAAGQFSKIVDLGPVNGLFYGAPNGRMVLTATGDLYGTASFSNHNGAVFRLSKDGQLSTVYEFSGTQDGDNPTGAIVVDANGNIFGTTYDGGANGQGIIYKIDNTGHETILHSFAGGATDGSYPYGGLVADASGNLYGTTATGGAKDNGTVFKIAPDGTFKLLATFDSNSGKYPLGALTFDAQKNLIGTTYDWGTSNGSIFSVAPDGTFQILFKFGNSTVEGARPVGAVTLVGSKIVGTTSQGGVNGYGTTFSLNH